MTLITHSLGQCNALLSSGFGSVLDKDEFLHLPPSDLLSLLRDKGVVVIRNISLSKSEFLSLYRRYGTAVEYVGSRANVGYGYRNTLELNGDRSKIVTGRGRLPFHIDGGLLHSRVDQVFLYAATIENLRFRGATLITDHVLAMREMPRHLRDVLECETFQVNAVERGFYAGGSIDGWFTIETFKDLGWVRAFIIYFPFDDNDPPSWDTRIVGFSQFKTRKFFAELGAFLRQPQYTYYHYWREGDLLIFDNRRSIHEREEFRDEAVKRVLWRGQTSESSTVFENDGSTILG
jgi:(5R)-carbapenem-3-carboxylate synthase